jgi:hypothetical protein
MSVVIGGVFVFSGLFVLGVVFVLFVLVGSVLASSAWWAACAA